MANASAAFGESATSPSVNARQQAAGATGRYACLIWPFSDVVLRAYETQNSPSLSMGSQRSCGESAGLPPKGLTWTCVGQNATGRVHTALVFVPASGVGEVVELQRGKMAPAC